MESGNRKAPENVMDGYNDYGTQSRPFSRKTPVPKTKYKIAYIIPTF